MKIKRRQTSKRNTTRAEPAAAAPPSLAGIAQLQEKMQTMNETLLAGSVRQREVASAAVALNAQLLDEIIVRKGSENPQSENDDRFYAIADNIPQLAWMADAQGRVNWFNRRWLDYTGTTLEANVGAGWKAVHHPDFVVAVAEKFERHLREGRDWEDTFPLRGKNGEYRWFLSQMKVIRDPSGKLVRFFGTNTDVTEQRKHEEALKESDRRKTEFLALLAHELRGPLAPLSYSVEILKKADGKPELVQPALAVMERQVTHMARLIDDLVDVSRISRGKLLLRIQEVELASVIQQVVEAARPSCETLRHQLQVKLPGSPLFLKGDPARLAQVFGNLLSNACKFTAPGGRISLTAERQGSHAVITVRDSGIGVSREQAPKIFEMFNQGDRTLERTQSGLGIGLALVRVLVTMHGGSIEMFSEGPGHGSEFVVRLPALKNAAASAVTSVAAPQPLAPRRILVVDDNPGSASAMAQLLKLNGHDTHTAGDGLAAVAAAEKLRPDVILMDLGMPKLNGFDAARRIREQPWGQKIVLVALTGWGQDEHRKKTAEAGFNGHLIKPVQYQALLKLLAELLRG